MGEELAESCFDQAVLGKRVPRSGGFPTAGAPTSFRRWLLITGATGKVGRHFLETARQDSELGGFRFRALCHNRVIPAMDRMEVVRGSISNREFVRTAMQDVTHVLHLATCKETPEDVMDVTMKRFFWLLEEARDSESFQQFILIGGDACVGHFYYPHEQPVTEDQPYSPYPGCYAPSKVMEEQMLEQYYRPYDLNGCCLRAPWIMEKDDFKYQLSFGPDVFGGPVWSEDVDAVTAQRYAETSTVPIMLDPSGQPVRRNFVHVRDLVKAIVTAIDHPKARQQFFLIAMDRPSDYRELGDYLQETRGLPSADISTRYHLTRMVNSKARELLGWRPDFDMKRMAAEAFDYQRAADDSRVVYYPG